MWEIYNLKLLASGVDKEDFGGSRHLRVNLVVCLEKRCAAAYVPSVQAHTAGRCNLFITTPIVYTQILNAAMNR